MELALRLVFAFVSLHTHHHTYYRTCTTASRDSKERYDSSNRGDLACMCPLNHRCNAPTTSRRLDE